ncbi:MAG TPA: patatin-like phospholipase family protein [Pseudacidobacterium sp.]|jgi:NTE family protein|nr:patatin-like phospholipase family protein [Pseudacidobacterium sp.]
MPRPLKIAVSGIVLSAMLAYFPGSRAAEPAAVKRPRIGVVLNGGGALGLAHIGALQWMEEHHIPVDIVTGTSMGGLVGGAYATGRTPEEIRELVQGIDWNQILSDSTPFRDLSYRRKEDHTQFPTTLAFGVGRRIYSQGGFRSGQQVQLFLDKIALPYSEVTNFDDLPIPFGCVATDLVSGRVHVFRSGSLSLALRATMSIPGVFAPVRAGDAIFADGGLLDNLPVDVAKEMGADVTIAIYLQSASLKPTERLSTFGALGRSLSVMIAANELRGMEQADVLVSIPLQNFSSLDYDRSSELIKRGYEAAESKATVLEKFAVDDATWQEYLAQRGKRIRTTPIPQFVEVTGVDKNNAERVREQLSFSLNKPIQPDKIARQLTTIASDQRIANLSYGLTTDLSGVPGLAISADPSPFGRTVLRPLFVIDGWDYKNVTLSVGGRFTTLDLGRFGAEWRNDLLLGSEYLASSEYFFPLSSFHPFLSARRWFAAPRVFGNNAQLNFYSSSGLIAEYRNRTFGGALDVGQQFGSNAELRLGYEIAHQNLYPNIGNPMLFPRVNGREGNTHLRFAYEGFDDPITPMSGIRLQARMEWWDAKPEAGTTFPLAEIKTLGFKSLTNRSSAYLGASGGSTLSENPGGLPPFSLGGSFRLPAYNTNELLTNQYFLFQGGYVRKIGNLSPLAGGRVLLFVGADVGKAYYVENDSRLPSDGSVGLVINTLFGPIVVGTAFGDTGHRKFFFQLGKTYF